MIDYRRYENKYPYLRHPLKPVIKKNPTPAEARAYADQTEAYEEEMKAFWESSQKWNEAQGDINQQFKNDVLAEYGLSEHPKAGVLYKIAWKHGHASGLQEVEYWVRELAELLL